MKRIFSLLLGLCLVLSLSACSGPAQKSPSASSASQSEGQFPITFTDSLGNQVTLESRPLRVVSLMGSYAESWVLSGGQDTLVGVTQDAVKERHMELEQEVTDLGSAHEPDLEAMYALNPDFVILTADLKGQRALQETLASANIPAAWFKVEAFEDYLSMVKLFTDINGRSDLYQENGLAIQAQIDAVLESAPKDIHPTVLLLRASSSGVNVKNSDNIAGTILHDLGCENIADSDSGLLEELQMESILAADPDYIFVTTMGSDQEKAKASLQALFDSDPAWQSLTAMKEKKVFVLEKELFHYKPNIRWGESYEVLANILYPQA